MFSNQARGFQPAPEINPIVKRQKKKKKNTPRFTSITIVKSTPYNDLHRWHRHIHQHKVIRILRSSLNSSCTVVDDFNLMPTHVQQLCRHLLIHVIVFCQENLVDCRTV